MSTVTFGYRIKEGQIEIDSVNGPRVQSIFKDYLSGNSLTDVALKNGFKFHGAIKRILINQTYLGDKYHPLLITPEVFNRAQDELHQRALHLGRTNLPTQQVEFYPQTKFKMNRSHHRYNIPAKQAEYLYQLIESEDS